MMPVSTKNESPLLVSVIITNFNYGRFIADAIDSSLAQTYAPLETIVVDDGSIDCSREVIQGYAGRIIYVPKENGGMGSALNAGFAASKGDVVIFLDSDDMLNARCVEAAVSSFNSPDVVKVHWHMSEVDADGRLTGKLVPSTELPQGDLKPAVIAGGPQRASGAPTSGNAWSRAFLNDVLPMPEAELRQHADSYLNTLAAVRGKVLRLEVPQGRYRVHGSNDYAGSPMSERFPRNLSMYKYRSSLLARHFAYEGTPVDVAQWEASPYFVRLSLRCRILADLALSVPEGATLIWIDDGAWGPGETLAHRHTVRLSMQAASDADSSDTENSVIDQMEQLRAGGANFVAFVKPALWRLDHDDRLSEYLRTSWRRVIDVEGATVFRAV